MLFVPSLVNRAYVLDLARGRSMLRWLAGRGVRPLLLDWGWPEAAERRFGFTELIAERLVPAIEAVGRPVVLAGYCMGGLVTVATAQLHPDLVSALALLATPWDFHAGPATPPITRLLPHLPGLLAGGTLPIDVLQALFALQDPGGGGGEVSDFWPFGPGQQAGGIVRGVGGLARRWHPAGSADCAGMPVRVVWR